MAVPFTDYSGVAPIDLANAILAPQSGIVIDAASVLYTGASSATSFYDGSLTALGIGGGILMTSGDGTPALTNTAGNYSTTVSRPGDSDLDLAVQAAFGGAGATQDAAVLEFSFLITDPSVQSITFQVVFGSDEFPEYSDSAFVDIAGVFVNGANVALFDDDPTKPLSIVSQNVDSGKFITNGGLPIEYDGVSIVLTIVAPVVQGTNTIKIAIADTGDSILDSGLFVSDMRTLTVDGSGLFEEKAGTPGADTFTDGGTADGGFYDLGDGGDSVTLGDGKNIVLGGNGADMVTSPGGASENVGDGGGDADVWTYLADYHPGLIAYSEDGKTIAIGADKLINFETVQFGDGALTVGEDFDGFALGLDKGTGMAWVADPDLEDGHYGFETPAYAYDEATGEYSLAGSGQMLDQLGTAAVDIYTAVSQEVAPALRDALVDYALDTTIGGDALDALRNVGEVRTIVGGFAKDMYENAFELFDVIAGDRPQEDGQLIIEKMDARYREFASDVVEHVAGPIVGLFTRSLSSFFRHSDLSVDLDIDFRADKTLQRGEAGHADVFVGNDGDDIVYLGDLDDAAVGGAGQDFLFGQDGDDLLGGGDGDDLLDGAAGNDLLVGGGGADTMVGGTGDDTYAVNSALDDVLEAAGEGTDTVRSAVSYVLGATLENLVLTGTAAIGGTGNAGANLLTGNGAANRLSGGAGDDRLNGGGGGDEMIGGAGGDTYVVDSATDKVVEAVNGDGVDVVEAAVSHTLAANVETLRLAGTAAIDGTGNAAANMLVGNAAANRLDGGAGADLLQGGDGDDVYVVDQAADQIFETATGGRDRVDSAVSYTLGLNVEILALTGSAGIGGTGNGLDNVLLGNAAGNRLDGGFGADAMNGGLGDDIYMVDNLDDRVTESSASGGRDRVESAISYILGANVENLLLTGAAAINGNGNALANILTGNGAANRLNGGAGADRLEGGFGNDIYIVDNAGDVIVESGVSGGYDEVQSAVDFVLGTDLEMLRLTGTAAIDGTGNAAGNALFGNAAANRLDGGGGADFMDGGAGDDAYVVDALNETVSESGVGAAGGRDRVESAVSFTLGQNIEVLTLTGTLAIDGVGNALDNAMVGNAAANRLDGGAGADLMNGGAGNDIYVVDSAADKVIESSAAGGRDRVESATGYVLGANLESLVLTGVAAIDGNGNALDNAIVGNLAANRINGGFGSDTMNGGGGNDTYIVDSSGDSVIESSAAGGRDRVDSSVGYILGSNLEVLTLTGVDAINGNGNALDNVIVGNAAANRINGGAGADTMNGGLGNDTYIVDDAGDAIVESSPSGGRDRVESSVTHALAANVEVLTLTGVAAINGSGNGLDNAIVGNAAANRLNGGGGADLMNGAGGDDSYVVDNAGDAVIESSATGGIDRVESSVAFTLGANIENLTLIGAASIDGAGNGLANALVGNSGANLLRGLAGNDSIAGGSGADSLFGGAGNDVLTGGSAADGFYFDTGLNLTTNVDTVADFSAAADTIFLDRAIFKAIAADGTLGASAFHQGSGAQDADDRIIYDPVTGQLIYDANGSGAGAAVLFAQLATGLTLTNLDIVAYTG